MTAIYLGFGNIMENLSTGKELHFCPDLNHCLFLLLISFIYIADVDIMREKKPSFYFKTFLNLQPFLLLPGLNENETLSHMFNVKRLRASTLVHRNTHFPILSCWDPALQAQAVNCQPKDHTPHNTCAHAQTYPLHFFAQKHAHTQSHKRLFTFLKDDQLRIEGLWESSH